MARKHFIGADFIMGGMIWADTFIRYNEKHIRVR